MKNASPATPGLSFRRAWAARRWAVAELWVERKSNFVVLGPIWKFWRPFFMAFRIGGMVCWSWLPRMVERRRQHVLRDGEFADRTVASAIDFVTGYG